MNRATKLACLFGSLILLTLAMQARADFCSDQWPGDYSMQETCIEQQKEGLTTMVAFFTRHGIDYQALSDKIMNELETPADVDKLTTPERIVFECMGDWLPDMSMVAYCVTNQEDAAKRLGKLK